MKRQFLLAAASMLFLTGLLGVGAETSSAATPVNIQCGEMITSSIVLSHDLHCSGTAFFVNDLNNPAGVTVDLGGHTVSSTGTTCAVREGGSVPASTIVEDGRIVGGACAVGINKDDDFNHIVFDGGQVTSVGVLVVSSVEDSKFIHGASFVGGSGSAWGPTVQDNVFSGPADGPAAISVAGFGIAYVSGNRIRGYSTGIIASGTDTGQITGNTVLGSGVGIVADTLAESPDGYRVDLSDNVVRRSMGDGILIQGSEGLSVTGNVADHNGADGIHLIPASGTPSGPFLNVYVAGNRASYNAALGINAPQQNPPDVLVADGGGNRAHHNGNPAQCSNITCS
jgi:hypothetical protein